jgi:ATP-binding cassette subfamily B protein IrtA
MKSKNINMGFFKALQLCGAKKASAVIAIFCIISAAMASLLPYYCIYKIIVAILTAYPSFSLGAGVKAILLGKLILLGIAADILFYFAGVCLLHRQAFATIYNLKLNFLRHFANLSLGFGMMMGSGNVRKIVDHDIEGVEEFLAHQFPDLLYALSASAVMLIMLLCVDWRCGAACLFAVALAMAVQHEVFKGEKAKKHLADFFSRKADMNNAAAEYVRGMQVLKIFNRANDYFGIFHKALKEYTKSVISFTLQLEKGTAFYSTLLSNIYLFIIPAAFCLYHTCSDYGVFLSKTVFYIIIAPAVSSVMMRTLRLSSQNLQFLHGMGNMERVLKEPEINVQSKAQITNFEISFSNVSFAYPGEKIPALKQISFKAKSKTVTAIVGESGSGKSTIAYLIPRFYSPDSGNIKIGGIDSDAIGTEELMQSISFVFQDTYLFSQSIGENIGIGKENASAEEIIAAAKAAQCHSFIMNLPQGYDTVLGSDGTYLSGGEQQRIAIAQAILKNAPIIVLDEATAFNDPENEHLIQKAFESLLADKTVIMIAHRLHTIRNADNIIVMNDGEIAEHGTHDTLMRAKGIYYSMWDVYTKTQQWNYGRK